MAGLRIAGIPIVLPWSSLLGVALLTWLFAPGFSEGRSDTGAYVAAGVFALLVYASILVHELAHAGAARRFGYPVREIRLYALGGYTAYERRQASPAREAVIAAAGPASTLAVALACWLLARVALATVGSQPLTSELLVRLTYVSIVLAIYNLLPGLPLDGGALVKSAVWALTRSEPKGTRFAAWCGIVVALAVFATPFVLAARTGGVPDTTSILAITLFAGWLGMGAVAALRQSRVDERLPLLKASTVARTAVLVSRDLPLSTALEQRATSGAAAIVVVGPDVRPLAVANDAAIDAVPEQRRPWVSVASVARTLEPGAVLNADLTGDELLQAIASAPAPDYLVIDTQGTLIGVLSIADVQAALGSP